MSRTSYTRAKGWRVPSVAYVVAHNGIDEGAPHGTRAMARDAAKRLQAEWGGRWEPVDDDDDYYEAAWGNGRGDKITIIEVPSARAER